ncbi:MAG: flagellar biosynthesis protein FlhB [Desulfobulbus propionicus]|nr:MAG: flagellar biosynthesis protein FlhB [Desulfobulbus propionicus]
MAEDSGSGERTEAPSAKRRSDFRKKGQVAQSREVQTAALFTCALLFWFFYGPFFLESLEELLYEIWSKSNEVAVTPPSVMQLAAYLGKRLGLLLAPVLMLSLIVGFFSTFFQIGWLLTGHPLTPDLSKLDPIKGMGKFFSRKSLVEVVKSLTKVLLIGYVAYSTILGQVDKALVLGDVATPGIFYFLGKTLLLIFAKIAAIMIFLAALDFAFVRWEMEEKMKMTKQEQKEEMKETEGDPHIKSKIRSIQRQLARSRMMASVPEADVVITNPTRIAVALKYEASTMAAPEVTAKGQELVAAKIRDIAREHDVPIIENPPVARLLHLKVQLGSQIPEELFKVIAEILAYVYSTQKR